LSQGEYVDTNKKHKLKKQKDKHMKHLLVMALAAFTFVGASSAQAADPVYTGTFSNKAISGYDTVAYFTDGKAVKGSSDFTTNYQGAKWQFSNAANLETFKANPTQYAPQYGGYCAWAVAQGSLASGDPEVWNIVDGKLYLNYNKDVESKWLPNKHEFIEQADHKFSGLVK